MKKILLMIAVVASVLVFTATTTFAQNADENPDGFNFNYRKCHNGQICREHGLNCEECYEYHCHDQNENHKQLAMNHRQCNREQLRRGCHR